MDFRQIINERGCPKIKGNPICCHPTNQNRLNVYDWMENLPKVKLDSKIVEVRFKNNRKGYFDNNKKFRLEQGTVIAVESQKGHDIGIVSLVGPLVYNNMLKKGIDYHKNPLKKVYRIATENDIIKWKEAMTLEKNTLLKSRHIIKDLNLNMKLADVEYQGDNTKATFYYIADERIDFRELIKVLAEDFRVRIEMRQIGSRQEAGLVGGIGPCGRELCCSTFMHAYKTVNTQAAKVQYLSMNMQKLSGMCGKLKCCLNHEVDVYEDARKGLPNVEIPLETKNGRAHFFKADVLKRILWYSYDETHVVVPLDVSSVEEILAMNKEGKKIENLEVYLEKETETLPEFTTLLDQDLTRFDKKDNKVHQHRRKNRNKNRKRQ